MMTIQTEGDTDTLDCSPYQSVTIKIIKINHKVGKVVNISIYIL